MLNFLLDAHAHIIENGYMNQLPLMGSQSIQGGRRFLHPERPLISFFRGHRSHQVVSRLTP